MIRTLTPAQLVTDVGLAAACLLVRLLLGIDNGALTIVVIVMAVSLALRRLSPAAALEVAWAGAIVQMCTLQLPDPSNAAILAVLFVTGRYGGRGVKWAGLASAVLGALVATGYLTLRMAAESGIDAFGGSPAGSAFAVYIVASAASLGLSWTLGLLARTWSSAREGRLRQALAEQSAVVAEERTRIARDMHDVVAHSLAVVIAQADGARYARRTDPEAVDPALVAISTTARSALAEVRLLLTQLRHDQDAGPQPVLADLEPLYEQLRASGLPVTVRQRGAAVVLSAGAQIAIYRIVQEALTNALRHGTADGALVEFDWRPDSVSAQISNRPAASSSGRADASVGSTGHGLDGMRERAVLAGGTLSADLVEGRFVVAFTLPAAPVGVVA